MYRPYSLTVSDFRLLLHLGYSDEEKHNSQCVSFSWTISFTNALYAVSTDKLDDAFCYARLTTLLKDMLPRKQYNLIEHLAGETYKLVRDSLDHYGFKDSHIALTVTKLFPPISDLHGAVSFAYKESE